MLTNYIDPLASVLGAWSAQLGAGSIAFRIALSLACAAVIGCERSHKRHSAGMRTFILVCQTGTLAMLLDLFCAGQFGTEVPLLSAAALVGLAILSGNSFLYSSKSQIKGLTTAVALWATGFVGLALGGGFYTAGLLGFVALQLCLSALPPVEAYLKDRSNHFEIHLELNSKNDLRDFLATLRKLGLKIDDIESNPAYLNSGLSVYSISITITRAELKKYKQHSEIIAALGTLDYVSHIEEIQ